MTKSNIIEKIKTRLGVWAQYKRDLCHGELTQKDWTDYLVMGSRITTWRKEFLELYLDYLNKMNFESDSIVKTRPALFKLRSCCDLTSTKTTFGRWTVDKKYLTLKSGYFICVSELLPSADGFSFWIYHMLCKSDFYKPKDFIRSVIHILNSNNQNLTKLGVAVASWYKKLTDDFAEHKENSVRPYDASSGRMPGVFSFKQLLEMTPNPDSIKRVDNLYSSVTQLIKEANNDF